MKRDWKRVERKIADLLKLRRVPVTGRQRGSAPDAATDPERDDSPEWLATEIKTRQQLPSWIKDAQAQARASAENGQLPIVVLHERGTRYTDAHVVIRLNDFAEWFV